MKEMAKGKKDNMLLKSEKPINREFSEENKLAELVASMKSEPSSPESPYVNLEDDNFIVEETDVKNEESNAEWNNPSPALIGISPKTGENAPQHVVVNKNMQRRPKSNKTYFCEVCHKEITTVKNFKIHMQQHLIRDNRGLLNCEHCPQYYARKNGLMSHYKERHPPRDVSDKEFCENSEQTEQIALVKSEPNETDSGIRNKQRRPKSYKSKFCEVCHKGITTTKHLKKIHMQKHFIRDNRGLLNCEKCLQYYASKNGLLSHYREKHPLKRVCGDKEFCENSEQTKRVALLESQPNETDSGITTITHNDIIMKETAKVKRDNMLLKSEKPAIDGEFSKENELAELVASMKSEPSSPKSPYDNLEDDKFTVEETEVKTEESNAELDNHSPALTGINPEMVDNNDDGKVKKKKVEEHKDGLYHVILPESDPDCTVTSIATAAHEKVTQKNSEEPENFMLSEPDSVDWNVPVNDKKFCEQSELSELMGSIKSEPSSPKSWKSGQEVNSIITNHRPDYKGPFKCKRCPKYFAFKANLTRHCRMDHRPKKGVKNATDTSIAMGFE